MYWHILTFRINYHSVQMEIKVGHELCYYNNIPIETLWAADIQLIIITMYDVNNIIIL